MSISRRKRYPRTDPAPSTEAADREDFFDWEQIRRLVEKGVDPWERPRLPRSANPHDAVTWDEDEEAWVLDPRRCHLCDRRGADDSVRVFGLALCGSCWQRNFWS